MMGKSYTVDKRLNLYSLFIIVHVRYHYLQDRSLTRLNGDLVSIHFFL
jgi:hypothetical protein